MQQQPGKKKDYLKALIKFISRGLTLKKEEEEEENLAIASHNGAKKKTTTKEENNKIMSSEYSPRGPYSFMFYTCRSLAHSQVYIHRLKIPFGSCML
jgi:hypothetical protein